MTEATPENSQPLNQEAKRLLQQTGEKIDPDLLYVLQLMEWAILEGKHGLPRSYKIDVRAMVENMMGMSHAVVMKFLTEDLENEDDVRVTADELLDTTPEEAAQILIQALHSAMSARISGYPPPLSRY
jgi:hypothetical protein